jgi:hypothetical protein
MGVPTHSSITGGQALKQRATRTTARKLLCLVVHQHTVSCSSMWQLRNKWSMHWSMHSWCHLLPQPSTSWMIATWYPASIIGRMALVSMPCVGHSEHSGYQQQHQHAATHLYSDPLLRLLTLYMWLCTAVSGCQAPSVALGTATAATA